jgi:hypothetical protein
VFAEGGITGAPTGSDLDYSSLCKAHCSAHSWSDIFRFAGNKLCRNSHLVTERISVCIIPTKSPLEAGVIKTFIFHMTPMIQSPIYSNIMCIPIFNIYMYDQRHLTRLVHQTSKYYFRLLQYHSLGL